MKYLVTWQQACDFSGIMQCKFFKTYQEAKDHQEFIRGLNGFTDINLIAIAEPKPKKTVKKILVVDL